MSEVRWKMYMEHKMSAICSSTYQKLLKLIEIWQSSDRNNFAQFFLRHRVYAPAVQIIPTTWFTDMVRFKTPQMSSARPVVDKDRRMIEDQRRQSSSKSCNGGREIRSQNFLFHPNKISDSPQKLRFFGKTFFSHQLENCRFFPNFGANLALFG